MSDVHKESIQGEITCIDGQYNGVLGEIVLKIRLKTKDRYVNLSPVWMSKHSCMMRISPGDTLEVYGNFREDDFYVNKIQKYIPSEATLAREAKLKAEEAKTKRFLSRKRKRK